MRWLAIMAKDLSQAARDWKTALFLLFMPLIFTVFFGIAAVGAPPDPRLRIGWIDRDAGEASAALRSQLAAQVGVLLSGLDASRQQAAEDDVRRGTLAAAVEVPAGFGGSILGATPGAPMQVGVVADSATPEGRAAVETVRAAVGSVLGSAAAAHLAAAHGGRLESAFAAALLSWNRPRVAVESRVAGSLALASGFTQASPGMIVQFAIFGLITSAMIVVVERRSGAMRRLLTTSASPATIVGGHFAAMLLIVLAQEAILVACGQLAFGVDYMRSAGASALVLVALGTWAASLGLLIGALARKEQQVVGFSLAAMFIFAALGGAWFPLDTAGSTFARVGHLLPSAWAMTGLQNVVLRGQGISSVLLPVGVLFAWAAGFFALAAWRFRWE